MCTDAFATLERACVDECCDVAESFGTNGLAERLRVERDRECEDEGGCLGSNTRDTNVRRGGRKSEESQKSVLQKKNVKESDSNEPGKSVSACEIA